MQTPQNLVTGFTLKPDKKFTKTYIVQCIDLEPNILYIYSERQQPKLLLLFTTHQPLFCFWLTIPWHYSVSLFQSVPIISNHTGNSVKEIVHCFAKSFHNLTYFAKQCIYYLHIYILWSRTTTTKPCTVFRSSCTF